MKAWFVLDIARHHFFPSRFHTTGTVRKAAIFIALGCFFLLTSTRARADLSEAAYLAGSIKAVDDKRETMALSPYWGPEIQQWAETIVALSRTSGFHPDFIAAVIAHEAVYNGQGGGLGTVSGLLDIKAIGSDTETQPSSEALPDQTTNLQWGIAVLSYAVQQSGGDLFTALAAYYGGWEEISENVPREHAAGVLDSFGRALAVRNGLSPDMATRWTVAVEIRAGNAPSETLVVLGNEPVPKLRTYGEYIIYAFAIDSSHAYYIQGYIVPIGLSESLSIDQAPPDSQELEAPLRARLGDKSARKAAGNSQVLLACLPSIDRLRGQVTTRWYSPSNCPKASR